MRPPSRSAQEPTPIARSTPKSTINSFTSSVAPSPSPEPVSQLKRRASARASTPSSLNPTSSLAGGSASTAPGGSAAVNDDWNEHQKRRRITRSVSWASLRSRPSTPDAASMSSYTSVDSIQLDHEVSVPVGGSQHFAHRSSRWKILG